MQRLLAMAALGVCAYAADFDILVRNARIIDGSGNPWYRGDAGIRDGRIVEVGRLEDRTAYRVIDAAEKVLAPGFIDVHTHIEGAVDKVPRGDNYILDGVTTVITGNCGGSEVRLGEWFGKLDRLGLGLNVGSLIGHNSVRREVMGGANRLASPDEISRMQAIVEQAMKDGAVGFSTGLIYTPGTYSNTDEVVALAKAASKYGGVYASHMRDEGSKVIEAIEEAVKVGKETGMPVELSHFKIDNRRLWGSSTKTLDLVEKYRLEGVDVVVDQYPYDRSSTDLAIMLPSWALADGIPALRNRLTDPSTRARIVADMQAKVEERGQPDYTFATVASFPSDRSFDGKTIPEIAAAKGKPKTVQGQIDTILEMMDKGGGAQMVYHSMGTDDVERIMKYSNTAIASDGGIREFGVGMPHPRAYGTNARVLAEYVRERRTLTLEDAIRRMTSLPARTFSLKDRGLVRPGMVADLVLFDPAKVQDKATFADPHHYSEGFEFVIINGKVAVEGGKPTDIRAGKVVRRQ